MKATDALGWAAIVGAGVVAYLVVKKAADTGKKAADAIADVITTDLNPTSTENVVYRLIPESWKSATFDAIDEITAPVVPEIPLQESLDKKLTDQSGLGLKVSYGQGLTLAQRMRENLGTPGLTDYEKSAIRLADSNMPVKAPNPFDFTRIPGIVRDIFN